MGWRVTLDRDLCQGHGMCELEAPDVFTVAKDGILTVHQDHPPDDRTEAVRQAVRYCPTRALSLTPDP